MEWVIYVFYTIIQSNVCSEVSSIKLDYNMYIITHLSLFLAWLFLQIFLFWDTGEIDQESLGFSILIVVFYFINEYPLMLMVSVFGLINEFARIAMDQHND